MEETLNRIIKRFEEELGPSWTITPCKVFDLVHYFDCQINGFHFLTHSYGIYKETEVEKIIKKEVESIRTHYRQKQQVEGVTS